MIKKMTLRAASCYERELLEGRNKKLMISPLSELHVTSLKCLAFGLLQNRL